jgi:hypothetical protein
MKYGLECAVTSRLKLPGEHTVSDNEQTMTFIPNASGVFAQIKVTASVPNPARFKTYKVVDMQHKTFSIHVDRDEELHKRLMSSIHSVESVLGFYFDLSDIHWNQLEAFVEPESDEEAKQLEILRWFMTQSIGGAKQEITVEQLDLAVVTAKSTADLTTTLAFHREGSKDMRDLRYISAFFSFYFVLEGLFGNGKTKNDAVRAEFKRSTRLVAAIQDMIDKGLPPSFGEDEGILERLRRMNKPCTPDSIIDLLVSTRGDVHHNVGNPKRPGGSPLIVAKFQTFSMFCMNLCQMILHQEIEDRLPPT